VHAVRLTPDAEKVRAAGLPHGDSDTWAAYYMNLVGPNANRGSWDALGLTNLYAVLLGGPDAYTGGSWHDYAAPQRKRQRENEKPPGIPQRTPANTGSHAHVLYVTLRLAPVTDATLTSPESQAAVEALHRFHLRCGFGDDELVEANTNELNVFNYWQECDMSPASLIKVFAYGSRSQDGCRCKDGWLGASDWAKDVLHAAGIQTEWSEHPPPVKGSRNGPFQRATTGRLVAVARMPFASLAAIPFAR